MSVMNGIAGVFEEENPNPKADDRLMRFANYAGSADTKAQASYLAKRGLLGVSDIIQARPNIASPSDIVSNQADWKPAKIGGMLMTARKLGVTPQNIDANWDVVMGNDRYAEAMKHPNFTVLHGNWKDVFKKLLEEQYAKEASETEQSIAKK